MNYPVGEKIGVLLINIGTPDAPVTLAVRRYLKQFLSDPRVVDLPKPIRWLILNFFILPFRPKYSAQLYRKIWTAKGSPLLVHSRAFCKEVGKNLGDDFYVVLGMRYGHPSIDSALKKLQASCNKIVVLPMFPQFSLSATESALFEVKNKSRNKNLIFIDRFFDNSEYINSLVTVVLETIRNFEPDFFLFSYHSIPEKHLKSFCRLDFCNRRTKCPAISSLNSNCYRAQCFTTSDLLARQLKLGSIYYGVSFQSRLNRTAWIRPYTDQYLIALAKKRIKRLVVICPSFVADCLETLEEIGIRAHAQWEKLGGEELRLVPSLNSHPKWVKVVSDMIRKQVTTRV